MRTDIFIVDDVSDNMLKHKFCHALLILVYGMCMGRRYKLDLSEYKGASKAGVAIVSVIGAVKIICLSAATTVSACFQIWERFIRRSGLTMQLI